MSLRNLINEQSRQISRLDDIMSRFYSSAVTVRGDFPANPPSTQLGTTAPDTPPRSDLDAQLAYNNRRLEAVSNMADYLASKLYDSLDGDAVDGPAAALSKY